MSSGRERQHRGRTVLVVGDGGELELVEVGAADRALAHVFARELDRQLAAGRPVSRHRLRAVRAGMLVAPPERRWLAACWTDLLVDPARPHAPVRWTEVAAARRDIVDLADALRAAQPVSARGVAIARLLLTDGTGPLYNARHPDDVGAVVRDALVYLDPLSTPQCGW